MLYSTLALLGVLALIALSWRMFGLKAARLSDASLREKLAEQFDEPIMDLLIGGDGRSALALIGHDLVVAVVAVGSEIASRRITTAARRIEPYERPIRLAFRDLGFPPVSIEIIDGSIRDRWLGRIEQGLAYAPN